VGPRAGLDDVEKILECKILVGKPLHRLEDNIKMDLEGVDWIHLT
jgi:hypothetical protein